jgi:hypothetical protein
MAQIKYIADVTGRLTEVKALEVATNQYPGADGTTTARDNSTDAGKMVQTTAAGVIDEGLLPRRTIVVGGTTGHSGMWAKLDANGKWDISLMPVGVGAEVTIGVTSEIIGAGTFCNIASTGIRLADNSAAAKKAIGFCLASYASGATGATMYGVSSKNTALTGLTKGTEYYLGTNGAVTTTLPTANGFWVQPLGIAESTTEMVFSNAMFGWQKTA